MGDVFTMRNLAFTFAVLTLGACVVDDDQPDESEAQSDVTSTNKLAANKLAANKLAANKLAANKLSASALPSNTNLVDSADGRDVLTYVVGCALTTAQSVQIRATSGTTYTFTGEIGLAPAWSTRAPTVSERHWVTSCVLSRVNLFGVSVQLSMRGATSALNATPSEVSAYTMDEGGFYGDLFDPAGPTEYACKSHITYNTSTQSAQNRQCAETTDGVTTKCGFTYTGVCQTNTCVKSTLPFANCHITNPPSATTITEVITVYLQPI
jgi:hypothetical protein